MREKTVGQVVLKKSVQKNSSIGIFFVATEDYCLVPNYVEESDLSEIERVLGVRAVRTRIAGTSLLGVFASGNSRGLILPYIARDEELKLLKEEGIRVLRIHDVPTAIGNLVCVNDYGAVVSELINKKNAKKISDFLGVDVVQRNIANNELPGASICATNKGFIIHPNASEDDMNALRNVLGVDGKQTTANYGDPFVGTCVVANTRGIIVGEDTTPVEIMAIEDALGVIACGS